MVENLSSGDCKWAVVTGASSGLGIEPDRPRAMLHVNIIALTKLTRLFGQRMTAYGIGRILLVGSIPQQGLPKSDWMRCSPASRR